MLRFSINDGFIKNAEIKGSTSEIVTDFMTMIHVVYDFMLEENEREAECFKDCIINNIKVAFMDSDEIDEECERIESKSRKKVEKSIANAIDEIKELDEGDIDGLVDILKKTLEGMK